MDEKEMTNFDTQEMQEWIDWAAEQTILEAENAQYFDFM